MNRLLYLDKASNEIENLLSGTKQIIMRAANIKKYPYKMIDEGYRVFFMNNNSEYVILASATIKQAIFLLNDGENVEPYLAKTGLRKQKADYIRKRKFVSVFILDDIKSERLKLIRGLYGVEEDWMRFERLEDDL